jgi:hypothetical protein
MDLRNLLKILDFGWILSLLGDGDETIFFMDDIGCLAAYGLGDGGG